MIKSLLKNMLSFVACLFVFGVIFFIAGLILSLFPNQLNNSLFDIYRQIK